MSSAGSRSARQVLVTGLGVVSPLGLGVQAHWASLLRGESAVTVSSQPEYRNLPHRQARVPEFEPRAFIPDRILRKLLTNCAMYPVIAAGEAIRSAGLEGSALQDCGLFVGSIGVDANVEGLLPAFKASLNDRREFAMDRFATRGMRLLDPLFLVKALPNAGLCGISIQYQVLGPNANVTNGTVSGLQAVAFATAAIRRGDIDVAVAGGYDSLVRIDAIMEQLLGGRMSLLSPGEAPTCRPFDVERDGFAAGEGAAFVVLESDSHAHARSAQPYCEIISIGQTTDGALVKAPPPGTRAIGLQHAAQAALHPRGCAADAVGAVFGDGLATEVDDLREAEAIEQLFPEAPVPFTAATGALGFTGAAHGPLSLVHAALGVHDQVLPPLTNCRQPDPRCHVQVTDRCRPLRYTHALVWNSDRGLKNIAVLVGAARG